MRFKFTENPNFTKILSLFLALIMWFIVTGNKRDALGLEVRQTFTNIPLYYRNLGQDLVVMELEESITLSLQGTPQAFDGLTPADLEAYVDLNGKRKGRHELRVYAVAPPGVGIVSIAPARVSVLLEDLVTRQMSVESSLLGHPAGGMIIEEINFTPQEVFIKGPRQKADLVQKVVFHLEVNDARGSIVSSAKLYPVDSRGSIVPEVTVTPDLAEVVVNLGLPQKDLPVKAVFKNNGKSVEKSIIEPSVIKVKGPQDLLAETSYLLTEEIDLTRNRPTVFSVEVPLVFPEGILPEKIETVRVQVFLTD
ncbi:MAG: YbbR-like domain-containing protein [Dethiobacteria bacterium]